MHYRTVLLSALVAIVVGLIAATALARHSGPFLAGDSGFQFGPLGKDHSGLPELSRPKNGHCPIHRARLCIGTPRART